MPRETPPERRNGPEKNLRATTSTPPSAAAESTGFERARRAWQRRPRLECGCTDPCRCDYHQHPTGRRVDGYRDAVAHLAAHGVCAAPLTPELRALWRNGGTDRQTAETILWRWSA